MSRHFLITAFPPTPESCRQALALPSTTRTRRIRLRVCLSLLLCAVLLTFALQLATIYVPWLNPIFRTEPLSLGELALCIGAALVVLVVVEIEKAWRRSQPQRRTTPEPSDSALDEPAT